MILHFHNNLLVFLGMRSPPSKPQLNLSHAEVICKQPEAAKHFHEEEGDLEGGQPTFHCPSAEGFELSYH